MDASNNSVFDLSPAEKLQLVEDLWDDLAKSPDNVPIHSWQIEEIDRRRASLTKNPESAVSWDEAQRRIRLRGNAR
jgi:putative addiction module component (TIGR02574 family)